MPKLPTADSLGYVTPRASPSVSPPDLTGPIRAIGAIGAEISKLSEEEARRQNASELIQAEAKDAELRGDLQRRILENPDYSSHEQMFKEGAARITDETSKMISSPYARDQWIARSRIKNESALRPIFSDARRLLHQDQAVDLRDSLDAHMNIIRDPDSSPESVRSAYHSIEQSVDLARRTGLVSPLRARRYADRYLQEADQYRAHHQMNIGQDYEDFKRDLWGGKSERSDKADRFSSQVNSAINEKAAAYGQDPRTVEMIVGFESSGDPKSRAGSHKGLMNLSESAFRNYGGTGDIHNIGANLDAGVRKLKDESQKFEERHGAVATPFDQWMIHNQGAGGYDAHLDNPAGVAWRNLMTTAEGRQKGEEWAKQAVFGNMTDQMKRRYGVSSIKDIDKVTSQDFLDGWRERVNKSLTAESYGGPYRYLTPQQRTQLMNQARKAYGGRATEEISNSLQQILDTGQAPVDERGRTALDRAWPLLTDKQRTVEQRRWLEATEKHKAVAPLTTMSDSDGRARIDELFPKPNDPNYAVSHRVYDYAAKEWEKIETKRQKDPADSVEKSPVVMEAVAAIRAQAGRIPAVKAAEMLIDARLEAQRQIGLPVYRQRRITQPEAKDLLQLPDQPTEEDIERAMKDANDRAKKYGKHAENALRDAIHMTIHGKTARLDAEDLVQSVSGTAPAKKDKSWYDSIYGTVSGIWGGSADTAATKPDPSEISWVQQDPANRWRIFDNKYGAGSWAKLQAEEMNR